MIRRPLEQKLLKHIAAMKEAVFHQPDFYNNRDLRAMFVNILTLEGALIYKDADDLAKANGEFIRAKAREHSEKN